MQRENRIISNNNNECNKKENVFFLECIFSGIVRTERQRWYFIYDKTKRRIEKTTLRETKKN